MDNEDASKSIEVLFNFNETLISLYYLIPKSAHASLAAADNKWRMTALEKAFGERWRRFSVLGEQS